MECRVSHRCSEHGGLNFDGGGRGGGLSRSMGELNMSKNTCDEVLLTGKVQAIILKASKFTKNELLHTYFSRILARF